MTLHKTTVDETALAAAIRQRDHLINVLALLDEEEKAWRTLGLPESYFVVRAKVVGFVRAQMDKYTRDVKVSLAAMAAGDAVHDNQATNDWFDRDTIDAERRKTAGAKANESGGVINPAIMTINVKE